jgi:hypothetical protein
MRALTLFALGMLAVLPRPRSLSAQPLERRIAGAGDGPVTFRFASRSGVCGDGYGTIGDGDAMHVHDLSSSRDARNWRRRCLPGPVRVVLTLQGGRVRTLRTFVGEPREPSSGTDLGVVGVKEGTDYLLALAESGDAAVGEDAILPAALADSVAIWPSLLRIARDDRRPHDVREQATFWLSQFATEKALGRRSDDEEQETDDVEDREQAVFALSQLENRAGVPALIQIARSHRLSQVRRKALFWLGQSGDKRALALFEELLKGA